jgi:hypothetical protein
MSLQNNTLNKKIRETFIGDIVSGAQGGMGKKSSRGGASFIGKDFNYSSAIRSPNELGMSPAGNFDALSADIAGLINYTEVLVSGTGRAIKGKLGNQYFLKTLAKCKLGGSETDRYLYINNVPTGNIKFGGTSLTGGRSSLRGLVPGMIENIGKINPLAMFQAFSEGTPECVRCPTSICPVTTGQPNKPIAKSEYNEIKKMRESFQNIKSLEKFNKESNNTNQKIMNNKIAFSYNIGLSLLAAYITYRLIIKK